MKKNNPFLRPLWALCISAALFSCNDNTENKEDGAKKAPDSSTATTGTPGTEVFTPFDVMEISHTVKDYAKWRPAFNSDATERKSSGMEDIVVGRGIDNDNNILIALKVSDVQKARDFAANPRLKEVMQQAGVISKPGIEFFHVTRFNPDSKEKQWVVVTHRVKDFDAWLKVFDQEGSENRAGQGLIDVVLSRGIDDPNIVHLVFDTKDLAKAKSSIFSEEKKKLMMSAGVEGQPKIEFYQTAE